jgi:hypothetical protein
MRVAHPNALAHNSGAGDHASDGIKGRPWPCANGQSRMGPNGLVWATDAVCQLANVGSAPDVAVLASFNARHNHAPPHALYPKYGCEHASRHLFEKAPHALCGAAEWLGGLSIDRTRLCKKTLYAIPVSLGKLKLTSRGPTSETRLGPTRVRVVDPRRHDCSGASHCHCPSKRVPPTRAFRGRLRKTKFGQLRTCINRLGGSG